MPKDFIFAVKANRFITHVKRLLDCSEPLKRLSEQAKGLGDNLGPVLFQLPPSWKANGKRLEFFLHELRTISAANSAGPDISEERHSAKGRPADFNQELITVFEFRHQSCFFEPIFKILVKYNAGIVINDSPHFPKTREITANFTYIRFHGPSALYSSEYSDSELAIWAKKIKNWAKSGVRVYGYFNNDVGGYAVKNARTLIEMVS